MVEHAIVLDIHVAIDLAVGMDEDRWFARIVSISADHDGATFLDQRLDDSDGVLGFEDADFSKYF